MNKFISITFILTSMLLSACASVNSGSSLSASAQGEYIDIFGKTQTACTRASLQTAVDSYIATQKAGDASRMSIADEAKFYENMEVIEAGKGLWNTALPIAYEQSYLDPARCKSFVEMIVTEGDHQYAIGTRLNVNDGKITEINGLVTDKGDWLFNAVAFEKFASREDWSTLKPEQRVSAQELVNGANAYLDLFSDKYVDAPFALPCERIEGGAYTNPDNDPTVGCTQGIPDGVLYIVNRSYLIDEEKGVINVFCRFGNSTNGMPDSHTFRLVNGKFRHIHTLSVNMNPNSPSPQADENGRGIPAGGATED